MHQMIRARRADLGERGGAFASGERQDRFAFVDLEHGGPLPADCSAQHRQHVGKDLAPFRRRQPRHRRAGEYLPAPRVASDELLGFRNGADRALIALAAALPPGDQTVLPHDHEVRFGSGPYAAADPQTECEPRTRVVHPHGARSPQPSAEFLAIARAGQADYRVGVGVVDMSGRQEGVQKRLD